MQKMARRLAMAERQVAKREAQRSEAVAKAWARKRARSEKMHRMVLWQDVMEARLRQRDAWERGPLASRPDVAELAARYGALTMRQTKVGGEDFDIPAEERERRCAWLGGPKDLNLVPGDRVAIVEGPEMGRIAKVKEINPKSAEVLLHGAHERLLQVPEVYQSPGEEFPAKAAMSVPLPISAVRLVHPLVVDASTGETRDAVIRHLRHGRLYVDRRTGRREWTRVVPGLNVEIPWPAESGRSSTPDAAAAAREHEGDTPRIDVDEATFVPTLLTPPVPPPLLDELRNRFSKFRTRHDPDFLARKEAEAEEARYLRLANRGRDPDHGGRGRMATPRMELREALRLEGEAAPEPELSDDMLERIGRVMHRNLARMRGETPEGTLEVVPGSVLEEILATPKEPKESKERASS